ncbi:MAG: DUF3365 domain-containing protein [Calditrichia bacterium]
MRLTGKVILILITSVTSIITIIFYVLAARFDRQIEQNLLARARSIYKNIVIARQWISDYQGIYVKKPHGAESNPFLPNPELLTRSGDTLTLKNPALVTRELSELSLSMGGDFYYHMASTEYINPANKPDAFEELALNFFKNSANRSRPREFYRIEELNGKKYFRYFAPLFTEESCLSCHSRQGYRRGDLRGGISVMLSIDQYQHAKKSNIIFIIIAAFSSIAFLSILIFVAIQRSVIAPLRIIEKSAKKMEQGNYNFSLSLPQQDEIGNLAKAFESMRIRIQDYTTQLQASERKYRSLIENSLEAIAIVDSQNRIIELNSKFVHLSGYPAEKLKQRKFNDLIDPQNIKILDSPLSTKNLSEHYESILFSKDKLKIPVEIYIIHGLELGDQRNLSFVYVRDLSERKKIEKYAVQAEKMFTLGQLSSGIAHEIRNPLFALSNNIDYLRKNLPQSEKFNEIYPELQSSIERIHKIISEILNFSKPHKPEFKKVQIEEIILNCIALVKKQFEKSSITIETDFQENGQLVEADAHQMEQVFLNLFLNAFQAMNNSGKLVIQTRNRPTFFEIQVRDTGLGIPPEEIHRIFDPFYSKSPNGTGLGLAIVQRILEDHHARYRVKSEPYIGTSFFIYLPYEQEKSS